MTTKNKIKGSNYKHTKKKVTALSLLLPLETLCFGDSVCHHRFRESTIAMARNRGHPRKNVGKEQNPSSSRASSSSNHSPSACPLKPSFSSKASVTLRKHLVPATSPPFKAASPTQQQLSNPVATPVNQLQE